MSKACAYCGSTDKKMTKEHIWPQSIAERLPTYTARFISPANKVLEADLVIKDVCEPCNNGPLSKLDEYGAQLFDAYFNRFYEHGQAVEFRTDWTLLKRWLLKISYNSARAAG